MEPSLPSFDRRMTDADHLMWRLDRDPYLSSTFANISVLDRPVDRDRFLRRVEAAVKAVPRLRHRVVESAGSLSPPVWVEDPDFDLSYHVRHVALPRNGSMRQLTDLATLIASDPFDRHRPLWQFWIVDGLRGGRGALIQKLHHTLADGEGSLAIALTYLDLERDAPDPEPVVPLDPGSTGTPGPSPSAEDPSSAPGSDVLRDLVTGSLRLPLGLIRQVRDLLADPAHLPDTTGELARSVRSALSELTEVDRARSPLWTRRSLRRHLEVLRAPFAETKDAARRLGGTLNTAFVTLAADAAGHYHDRRDAPVENLRASMAVSTRTEGSGANAFTLTRMMVPTGPMPIDERFAAIHELVTVSRSGVSGSTVDTLAGLAAALPATVVTRLARLQTQTVDFATSNVKGAPMPVYVAGAQILENYPIGPLVGVACNLTLLSYRGSLDIGLHLDPAAVTDPGAMKKSLERSLRRLLRD